MPDFDTLSEPLPHRLRDATQRLAAALRADQWDGAAMHGLNPAQAQLLAHLVARAPAAVRVGDLARQLGVSQPSATDSVGALVRKGLATKGPDPADARAAAVRPTEAGTALSARLATGGGATLDALATLPPADQAALLGLLLKTIRALQEAGAIPPQRLCVTCRHFRPHAHNDADRPHHCALVDAPFGARHLRVDCAEHDPAPPLAAAETWRRYAAPTPQAGA